MRGSARALLGRAVWTARRLTPRLEHRYARLRSSTALSPGMTVREHEQMLLRYYGALQQARDGDRAALRFDVVVIRPGGSDHLAEALASVALQVGCSWRVWLPQPADDRDRRAVARFESAHPGRLRWLDDPNRLAPPDDPAGDDPAPRHCYVVLLDARDRLLPNALAEAARWLAANRELSRPDPDLLYSDDRIIDAAGHPQGQPRFRPGWSPLLLLGGPYTGRLLLVHRRLATAMARPGSAWSAALTAAADPATVVGHIPQVLYQARAGEEWDDSRPTTGEVAARAVFCAARGWPGPMADTEPVQFPVPRPAPKISIIVPTRDRPRILRTCLDSVLGKSDYPDFEVIVVDNGSRDPVAQRYLNRLADHPAVRLLRHPGPFNFAAMNNRAAQTAAGSVLVLLNNDTEVLTPAWLRVLAGTAVLPGVGAVGPQLRYPDGRIQHAGLVGLAEAGTGHAFVARQPDGETPLDLLHRTREVLAVTGACLAVSREAYLSVGGLAEALIPNDSGDVDLCLRLRQRGLANVYTPAAVLVHHESVTRQRSFLGFERFWLQQRWPAELLNDPYLNPNLAKSTRLQPDYRFPIPDVPDELLARWLAAGSVLPLGRDHGDGEVPLV